MLGIVNICHDAGDLAQLNSQLVSLSKKHGQLKQVAQKMVERAIEFLDALKPADRLTLINTLRDVTEGKARLASPCTQLTSQIYLEVPRARVTRMLSKIREDEGDSAAASELLQDLQVETFGSMDRREKIDFILEQMRLLRVRQDWDRLGIVSKKINSSWLADAANEDLKLRFHALMIRWALHFDRYLDMCKHMRSVLECKSVAENDARRRAAIRNALLFVILAPHDNEQSDLLARVAKDPHLLELDDAHGLATCFTTPELMRWPGIIDLYGSRLRQTRVFGEVGRPAPASTADVGDLEEENEDVGKKGQKRWDDLHTRVLEHVRRMGCASIVERTFRELR